MMIVEKGDDSKDDYVVAMTFLPAFLPEYHLGAIVVEVGVWVL
jgi:hypothetical protein